MEATFQRIGRVCDRYGPGRLPRADDRAVGAGYAGASAATVAALVFVTVMMLAGALGVESVGGLAAFGLGAIPLVVPGAFVAGWATWRSLPPETAYFGLIAGTIAVFLTYLIAAALLFPLLVVPYVLADPLVVAIGDGVVLGFLIVWFAFITTFWLTVPLGVASGYVYERARAATA